MNMKKTLIGVATLAVVLGMLPGAAATINTNDAVTRTFDVLVIAQIQFEGGGTGIYSAGSPCPLTIFGVRPNIPIAFYYGDDREGDNLKTGGIQLFTGQTIPITGVPCPIPGSGTGDLTVAVGKTNFWGPYHGVVIDQLLCLQGDAKIPGAAVDCFPDPTTSKATIALCNKEDANFTKGSQSGNPKVPSKSALNFGPPVPELGSWRINCLDDPSDPTDGLKNAITYYMGGPTSGGDYCADWFFDNGNWGTDFCVIQTEDIVPLGNGAPDKSTGDETGYIVTCMSTSALVIQSTFPKVGSFVANFASHDYKLILDLDAAGIEWPENVVDQYINTKTNIHWANNFQGWHDLSGKNGAPCPLGVDPEDKKAKPAADGSDFGNELMNMGCPDPVTHIPRGCHKTKT